MGRIAMGFEDLRMKVKNNVVSATIISDDLANAGAIGPITSDPDVLESPALLYSNSPEQLQQVPIAPIFRDTVSGQHMLMGHHQNRTGGARTLDFQAHNLGQQTWRVTLLYRGVGVHVKPARAGKEAVYNRLASPLLNTPFDVPPDLNPPPEVRVTIDSVTVPHTQTGSVLYEFSNSADIQMVVSVNGSPGMTCTAQDGVHPRGGTFGGAVKAPGSANPIRCPADDYNQGAPNEGLMTLTTEATIIHKGSVPETVLIQYIPPGGSNLPVHFTVVP
jgi:hypothetical protein